MSVSMRPPLLGLGSTTGFGGFSTRGTPAYNTPTAPAAGGTITPQQYDAYIAKLTEAWAASAGIDRDKLAAEIADAREGRKNAYRIAQLQAETQRYGYDVNRETELARLQETQRQFDATHALDMQRFGLDYAQAYSQAASTPDLFFQRADLQDAFSRAQSGQGPSAYGSQGAPTAKTPADFAVLAGYPAPNAAATGSQSASAGGSAPGGQMNAAGTAVADNRPRAIAAMVKAMPPSNDLGMNDQDFAVLQAARALYEAPGDIPAGTLQQWRPGQQKAFESAGRRLSYDPVDWMADYRRRQVGQGSASAA